MGCWANATPAVAVAEGSVWIARLFAAPGLTTTFEEVAPEREPAVKETEIVSARL